MNDVPSTVEFPWYYKSFDIEQVWRDYPPPPDFFGGVFRASRDELRALQERRFLQDHEARLGDSVLPAALGRGRHRAGRHQGPRRPAEDSVLHGRAHPQEHRGASAVRRFHGHRAGRTRNPMPLVLQTSGGTTGLPRPMLYSPHDREIMAILGARRYAMQGMRPGDMVLVAFSLGLSNGGLRQSRDPLEIHGRGAGDDRRRRHHADAAADRDLQGLGHQCRARLSRPICVTWRWWRATRWASTCATSNSA